MSVRTVDDRDAEIERQRLRIAGLENQLQQLRARVYYAEGEAREATATVCPMAIGDPHHVCTLAEALSDTLARACGRDDTLAAWLDETATEDPPA